MLRQTALAACISAISFSTIADDWNTTTNTWAEDDPTQAVVMRVKGDDKESFLKTANGLFATISHDTIGRQSLYIRFIDLTQKAFCTPGEIAKTSVIKVNGQAVRMYQECEQEDFISAISMWPFSQQGKDFLIDAFKTSPKSVRIEYRDFKLDVPAVGFTQSWANAGGDAL